MDLKINNALNSNIDVKQIVSVRVLKDSLSDQKKAADQILDILKEPGTGKKVDLTV